MDSLLVQIKTLIDEKMKTYLNDLSVDELEDAGAIFYMNGNNGTEFDRHVNGRLSYFMIFYSDDQNLGAAKLGVYQNGQAELFLYSDKGEKLEKELKLNLNVDPQDLLKLAVKLKDSADDKQKWDVNIEDIDTDIKVSEEMVSEFEGNAEFYVETIDMRKMMNMMAFASKKILSDGWKVGIMTRDEPNNEMDSGWYFGAGNETQEYMDNHNNFMLVSVGEVARMLDPDIIRYISYPERTQLIRISSTEFIVDDGKSEIFCEKKI